MTAAPDVLWLHDGELYDATATAWDARNLQPLVVETVGQPLRHRADCIFREAPDLAEVCPCTADQRYPHRHPAEVAL